ncbi:hypothetical protein GF1_11630 [Desulfolithobacter dissulfuricans]|uniref:Uncharacterized protein n=1 Tax=Desulfolithobacter dissulfuricans TaxID=2795293 RepID=A0A915XJK9_9BACT|nr:hypothetical protein [Desulfolithobacter dissulfuricans]BCO08787.1 hypothetical protein GF1_11630 [Desulfolithobacter dissulfuricans]
MQAETKRTWTIDGKTIHEDEVKVVEMEWHVCDEILAPLQAVFTMMADYDQTYTGPIGTAGMIGEVTVEHARERIAEFFSMLKKEVADFELIVATGATPGIPRGTLLAIEAKRDSAQEEEVA